MAIVNGHIIQAGGPVAVNEVQRVLATSASSVAALCTHTKINRYAKFKPYNFGGILPQGITDTIIEAYSHGMKPTLINYDPATAATPNSRSVLKCETPWKQWQAPNGNYPSQPYRLGDFRGYDHKALPDIAKVTFMDANGGTNGSLMRDVKLTATLNFNPGDDARVFITGCIYNGTSLRDLYLTMLVVNRYNDGQVWKWGRYCFAAQSDRTLYQGRAGASSANGNIPYDVTIDLSGASDEDIIQKFCASDNLGSHLIVIGLAPKMSGIADADGKAIMLETFGHIPDIVSLNMWKETVGSVEYNAQLGSQASSGVVTVETFEVVGGLRVLQGNSYPATTAKFTTKNGVPGVEVNIGGRFILGPRSTNAEGRFKVSVVVSIGNENDTAFSDAYVFFSDKGIKQYEISINNGIVTGAAMLSTSDGTMLEQNEQELNGPIFVPYSESSGILAVDIWAEGHKTTDRSAGSGGVEYLPVLVNYNDKVTDLSFGYNRWDGTLMYNENFNK